GTAGELIPRRGRRRAGDPRPRSSTGGRLLDTEQLFRRGGEKTKKWPVLIPEEELAMSFPGIKVRYLSSFAYVFLSSNTLPACAFPATLGSLTKYCDSGSRCFS
ncbi:Os02g0282600, partial [Oryza sativa Japonica Group]